MSDERGRQLSVSQVAKRIKKGHSTVYRMKDKRQIPFFKGGAKQGLYTYELYVENWIKEREGAFYQ